MATPRRIRELAFHMLFQLDAQGQVDALRCIELDEGVGEDARHKAERLARAAYEHRAEADRAVEVFAPGWPAHRQPAVDRAILRLAHYEMTVGGVAPAVAINEAIELAKEYSTERSPGFINAILDNVRKQALSTAGGEEA
jgi:N utilization substance protein B